MLKTLIIIGSTREGRLGDKVARWYSHQAEERDDIDLEVIDLRDWPLPFFDKPMSPAYSQADFTSLEKKWAAKIAEADGFIIVTPEYNHSYPAVLKNALDFAYVEWNKKPIGFVSYGGVAGGSRAVEHLRMVAIELQMVPIRDGIHIPSIFTALDEEGNPKAPGYTEAAQKMLEQFVWWAQLLKEGRGREKK